VVFDADATLSFVFQFCPVLTLTLDRMKPTCPASIADHAPLFQQQCVTPSTTDALKDDADRPNKGAMTPYDSIASKTHVLCLVAGAVLASAVPYALSAVSVGASRIFAPASSTKPAAHLVVADASTGSAFSQYDVAPPSQVSLPAQAAERATESLVFAGAPLTGTGPSTVSPAPALIAADVDAGVTNMNRAIATGTVAVAKMSESMARNGVIAALAYDDPAVKEQTDLLANQLGKSLRGFADAVGKDMQRSIRESGIQQQSLGR